MHPTETDSLRLPDGLQCALHRSWDTLDPLEDEWDSLVAAAGQGFYDTYACKKAWWQVFADRRRLLVLLVRRDADLIAVLPFFRETPWIGVLPVRLLRPVGCDFVPGPARLTVRPGAECDAASALAASAPRLAPFDLIQLGPLARSAFDPDLFLSALADNLPQTRVKRFPHASPRVFFNLPDAFERYLAQLSAHARQGLRRGERILKSKGELTSAIVSTGEDLHRAFEDLLKRHLRQWRGRGKLGYFAERPRIQDYHRALNRLACEKDRIFILNLLLDGKVVASEYAFHFADTVHSCQPTWQDSPEFRKIGLGHLAFLSLYRHCINTRARTLDFGGPPIHYKLDMGGRLAWDEEVLLLPTRPSARFRVSLFHLAAWLLHRSYIDLWRNRLAPALKGPWRPLWPLWIRSQVFPIPRRPIEGSHLKY